MLSVAEARAKVFPWATPLPVEHAGWQALPVGRVLAADILSDVDSPPYDKSIVDGYALIAADVTQGAARLQVIEEVLAGQVPRWPLASGQATRIMTGAPIPTGATAVAMVERTQLHPAAETSRAAGNSLGQVEVLDPRLAAGQNILRRGVAMRTGDRVLSRGTLLRAIELGLLAEAGCGQIPVYRQPHVSIISTGNELVPAEQKPAPGQIRNSNGPMLAASVIRSGGVPQELGIVPDTRSALKERIAQGLESDVLLLSGGVSAGVLDLVPEVLLALGVEPVFHKIRMKPGKPLWFGVKPRTPPWPPTLVFGLPGNPVSSLVGFELLVRPALARLSGWAQPDVATEQRALARAFLHRGDRPTYHPARRGVAAGCPLVDPLDWQGSADLRTLSEADCLIAFPAGDRAYRPEELVEVWPL